MVDKKNTISDIPIMILYEELRKKTSLRTVFAHRFGNKSHPWELWSRQLDLEYLIPPGQIEFTMSYLKLNSRACSWTNVTRSRVPSAFEPLWPVIGPSASQSMRNASGCFAISLSQNTRSIASSITTPSDHRFAGKLPSILALTYVDLPQRASGVVGLLRPETAMLRIRQENADTDAPGCLWYAGGPITRHGRLRGTWYARFWRLFPPRGSKIEFQVWHSKLNISRR